MTVNQAASSIKTTQSNADGAPIGTAITNSAHVTGANPTGTVTFWLYGPNNPTCVNNSDSGLASLQSWVDNA